MTEYMTTNTTAARISPRNPHQRHILRGGSLWCVVLVLISAKFGQIIATVANSSSSIGVTGIHNYDHDHSESAGPGPEPRLSDGGKACTTGAIAISPTVGLSSLFGSDIGAWVGEGAVAIAIIIALIWIKIVIIAMIAWWWYGSSGKNKGNDDDDDSGYGWGQPKPVYGPPKPQYGPPMMSGYGRALYDSLDFGRLSKNVLSALEFVEKYYNYNEANE